MVTWLVTISGDDRPDLLQRFSESFALLEGVFLDSQHSVMEGKLVALVKVSFPGQYRDFAYQSIARVESQGLQIAIQELAANDLDAGVRLTLDLAGSFRFGIDHEIRLILESHGANIEQLNQHYIGEPSLGEQQFSSRIRANLSRPISEANLLQALSGLAPDLRVQIDTEELTRVWC
ncbi:ACT domain-containing protein [Marinobacterium arenosum]|uniref:ACT domain-containing protein n=1 Tax=Marinobacterium arenosum TaxID=2862496 RepID=UPI001C96CA59|nr:ACT domain-containing protein [Marinobacterium arenosum]MBY4678371.1 hypothetical protein [Marinobacterium arenosum]